MHRVLGAGAASLVLGSAAWAGEWTTGVYIHDAAFVGESLGVGAAGREGGADLQLGMRTSRLAGIWGRPQAHVIASFNSRGTSNFLAAGASWPVDLTAGFYLRPGLGLALTDGKAGLPAVNAPGLTPAETARRLRLYNTRIDFGSKLLFQPELALGYRLNEQWAAEVSWVHLSNGQILHKGKNQGLDDLGLRVSRAF